MVVQGGSWNNFQWMQKGSCLPEECSARSAFQVLPSTPTNKRVQTGTPRMQQSAWTDWDNRPVIRREWYNTEGQLHRTTGPAVEQWTILPGGAHVQSYQVWVLNGKQHREGRPAARQWYVDDNDSRNLEWEEWVRHGKNHRVGGPSYCHASYCHWTVGPDGTRPTWETWHANDKLHRVDGPAYDTCRFYWYDRHVREEDLPWLRCGQRMLAALAGARGAGPRREDAASSPTWTRDERLAMTESYSVSSTPATYLSVVGGSVLLCV